VLEIMTKEDWGHWPDSFLATLGLHGSKASTRTPSVSGTLALSNFLIGEFTTRQPVKSSHSGRYIAATGLSQQQSPLEWRNFRRTMLLFSGAYRLRSTLNESGRPIAPGEFVRWERLLRSAGFRSEILASAEGFVSSDYLGQAKCPILDVHMPGISGVE